MFIKEEKSLKRLIVILLVAVLLIVGVGGCGEKPPESLKMAVIPAGGAIAELEKMQPIADYLSEYIEMPIEFVVCTDYTAVVVSLATGDCDFARFGPFNYLLAVQEADAEIMVTGVKAKTGKAAYHSYIIAHPDSGIETLDDLKGHTFAFVDVASASGYLYPQAVLRDAGIDPDKDLTVQFAGSHPAVIEVVRSGHVDAGATCDNRIDDALDAGALEEGEINVIYITGPIPTSPTACRPGLDPELKEKIIQAYLNMPPEIAVFEAGKLSGYVRAQDSDYDFLRVVAEVLDLDLTK